MDSSFSGTRKFDRKRALFQSLISMYRDLERSDGVKIIHSARRTGPLGFLACIVTCRKLITLMEIASEKKVRTIIYQVGIVNKPL